MRLLTGTARRGPQGALPQEGGGRPAAVAWGASSSNFCKNHQGPYLLSGGWHEIRGDKSYNVLSVHQVPVFLRIMTSHHCHSKCLQLHLDRPMLPTLLPAGLALAGGSAKRLCTAGSQEQVDLQSSRHLELTPAGLGLQGTSWDTERPLCGRGCKSPHTWTPAAHAPSPAGRARSGATAEHQAGIPTAGPEATPASPPRPGQGCWDSTQSPAGPGGSDTQGCVCWAKWPSPPFPWATADAPVLALGGKMSIYSIVLLVLYVCIVKCRFVPALVLRGHDQGRPCTQPSFKAGHLGVTLRKCSRGMLHTAGVERG